MMNKEADGDYVQFDDHAEAIEKLERELAEAREKLDNLEVQAVRDVVGGWVSIPEVEWDSIMRPAANGGEEV